MRPSQSCCQGSAPAESREPVEARHFQAMTRRQREAKRKSPPLPSAQSIRHDFRLLAALMIGSAVERDDSDPSNPRHGYDQRNVIQTAGVICMFFNGPDYKVGAERIH